MNTTQTKTAKHTPLPWLLMPNGLSISGNDPEGIRYQELARMVNGNSVHPHLSVTDETQRANAALIVRAVNSHEELLGACKTLLAIVHQQGPVVDSKFDIGIEQAQRAIAKAGGEL